LPFAISGNASSRTYAAGTMYAGNRSFRCARNTSALGTWRSALSDTT
jgi:hypothetical protein